MRHKWIHAAVVLTLPMPAFSADEQAKPVVFEVTFLRGQSYVSLMTDLIGRRVLEVVAGRDTAKPASPTPSPRDSTPRSKRSKPTPVASAASKTTAPESSSSAANSTSPPVSLQLLPIAKREVSFFAWSGRIAYPAWLVAELQPNV